MNNMGETREKENFVVFNEAVSWMFVLVLQALFLDKRRPDHERDLLWLLGDQTGYFFVCPKMLTLSLLPCSLDFPAKYFTGKNNFHKP